MSITKRTMDCYDIRVKGEWATICVREWRNKRDDLTPDYYGGEVLIHSSFGSWGNSWSACGYAFRRFLIGCNFDYLFGKFMGASLRKFDGDESIKRLRTKILEMRRAREINAIDARDIWEEIDADKDRLGRSVEGFVEGVWDIVRDRRNSLAEEFNEPWYMTVDKNDCQAEGFWRELWPVFVAQIQQEIDSEKVPLPEMTK